MNADGFQRAERLFHEALARTPASREGFIVTAAAGDAELAARVQRMIRFAEDDSGTVGVRGQLGDVAADRAEDDDAQRLVGATIGPYTVGALLGEGGFGFVYRAEQSVPIRRSVALKILRSGMDSQQVISRFESERAALALMEHPNIARVLDAGRTEPALGSRPFFAMELVNGQPITSYCNEHALSTDARLELFITVCQAVQHAHQKGIIHRDLKPSNILVAEMDGVATPKVIDFGIAKATQRSLTERTLVTEAQQMLGTPQYMSPEQADADVQKIDTRSDIYSLGVVLYELMTGSTPIEAQSVRNVSYSQMQKLIIEGAAERPSTRLTQTGERSQTVAQQHGTSVPALRRRLRGDLDWVVLKALEHDRDRRYSSASAFADDIRRSLNHEPVLAGPPGAAYRMRKFVRRHRVGVIAASLIVLALIGGTVGTIIGMLHARASAEQAQAAADEASSINQFMREVLSGANPNQGGADVRLAEVLQTASEKATARFAGHPNVEAQVHDMLGRVFMSLDLPQPASDEFQRAVHLALANLGPDARFTLEAQAYYAQSLIYQERARPAEALLREIVPRIERLAGPRDPLTLRVQYLAAAVQEFQGHVAEAEAAVRVVRERALAANADDVLQIQVLDALIVILRRRLTDSQPDDPGLVEEFKPLAAELIERSTRVAGPDGVPTVHARVMLADVLQANGEYAEAAAICREVLASASGRLGECHVQLQLAMSVLARTCSRMGQPADAADMFIRLIDCIRIKDPRSINMLIRSSDALPYVESGGRFAEGEAMAREFVTLINEMGGAHDDMLFNADVYIARFVMMQGRLDEAQAMLDALEGRRNEPDDSASLARLDLSQGELLLKRGQYEQAEQRLLKAGATLGDIRIGTSPANPNNVIEAFIALYQAWGEPKKVADYQRLLNRVPSTAPSEAS